MSSTEGDGPPPDAPQPDTTAGEASQPAATPDNQAPEQSQDHSQAPSAEASRREPPQEPSQDAAAQAEAQPPPLPESAPVPKEAVIPECKAYDRAKLQPKLQKSELGRQHYGIHHIFGIDVNRRGNLFFLERELLAFAAGNALVLLDTVNMRKRYIFGIDGRGVGAVAVNASRTLIAVGEKGNHPCVYIYSYPALQIIKILRQGTEHSYAALAFDASGEKLASLGGAPDHLLTVWDWEREAITLHAKAFGQDIFSVSFSPDDPGKLVSSGTGHIRFWKMASTFTGLKLQGDIGKFGKVELSDIEAFAILPDGKVLSSTESGALLLWEGNFIKLRVVRRGGRACHTGPIYVVQLERKEGYLVTAGQDGYIRWWDLPTLDTVEIDSDKSMDLELEPVHEAYVGDGVIIRHMCRWRDPDDASKDKYAIQDMGGGLWTFELSSQVSKRLLSVPGGGLAGLDVSPGNHFATSCGVDGAVRCWDYVARRQLYSQKFECPASLLRWAPASVCHKTRTLAVGFSDGTLRLLYRLPEGWKRLATLKPHAGAVCAIEYSPTGHLLATGGQDGSVFLFHVPPPGTIDGVYEPIGFVSLGSPVTSLCWRGDGLAFLYTLQDGGVGEADLSKEGALAADVSKSYEIKVPLRAFVFKRKPQAVKPVVEEGKAAEEAKGAAAAEGQPGDQPPEAPPEEKPAHFSALQVVYHPDVSLKGRFLLTLGGDHAGFIFDCAFDSEHALGEWPLGLGPKATQEEGAHLPAAVSLRLNQSRDLLITGCDDGSVSVRGAKCPGFFARVLGHDGDRGRVISAVTSFDDTFLLSAGRDGLLVVYNLKKDTLLAEAVARGAERDVEEAAAAALLARGAEAERDPFHVYMKDDPEEGSTAVLPGFTHVESSTKAAMEDLPDAMVRKAANTDITDPTAYSIQDAKLKTEEDNQRRAAEVKKAEKRRAIAKMRDELRQLMDENEAQPPERKIGVDEFVIDREYSALLEQKGQELFEEVQRECAYESELSTRRLDKLRRFYLDDVEVEGVEIRGLKATNVRVSCFRTVRLAPDTVAALREIHGVVAREGSDADSASGGLRGRGFGGTLSSSVAEGNNRSERDGGHGSGEGDGRGSKASTLEVRKKQRQERKRAMQALLSEKPREDAADPRDLEAIAYAETHMGDYKLKSSASYEVPEDQRMNAEKKLRQMILLEESLHNIRMRFNTRLLALRDRKLEVINMVQKANKRIREIDAELGQPEESQSLWEPPLVPSEWPEARVHYTPEDLQAFAIEVRGKGLGQARPPLPKALPKDANPLQRLNNAEGAKEPAEEIAEQAFEEVMRLRVAVSASEVSIKTTTATATSPNSSVETARRLRELTLLFERQHLIDRIATSIITFDDALSELRREKIIFQADLKAAETRMLLLVQELALLRNFEAKDRALALKLHKSQAEKADVVAAITDCQGKLLVKKKEVETLLSRDAGLQKEFLDLVPPSHPHHPALLKIFRRRIKRTKKKEDGEDAGPEDDEEEEEDDEDYDDEDEDEDEEGQDDSCPNGCDVTLHVRVLTLRERRLDMEEMLQEFHKSMEELKRTNDRHVQRQKQVDKDLVQTQRELRAFQTEKQVALNQLDMVVPLTLKQVLCMDYESGEGEGWPATLAIDAVLGSHVLMTKKDLHALDQRTKELETEIRAQRHNFKALHKEKSLLEKEKASKEADIEVAKARCVELQMLKFGQLIDIESLDQVCVGDVERDLKSRTEDIDNNHLKEIKDVNRKHEQLRSSLLGATQRNTGLLVEIANLNGRRLMMERELDHGNKQSVVADTSPVIKVEMEERNRLMALVELQAKELDVLKAEISLLRRKGGPVYAAGAVGTD